MLRPEPLARAHGARQQLLRLDRAVVRLGRLQAGVAVAAGLGQLLAEVAQQHAAAALHHLAVAEHGVQAPAARAAVQRVGLALGQHLAQQHHVLQAVAEPGVGGQAVAAGAAGLLVVGLERLRQVEVRHEPHVRLVDAHAEGDGRHHDQAVLAQEALLVHAAHLGAQARVVGQGGDAVVGKERRRLLGAPAREAVDDAGVAGMLALQEAQQLLPRRRLAHHPVRMLGRSKPETNTRPPSRRSFSTISSRVRSSAVAVQASRGTPAKRSASTASCRYSGRKSCPHWETQWASSIATSDRPPVARASRSRVRSCNSRSGATYSRSSSPRATCASTRRMSSTQGGVEERRAHAQQRRAATWSCISAMSGETTTPRPGRSRAGIW